MASYAKSAATESAHAVSDIPDMNPVQMAGKSRTGVVNKAGIETGLSEYEKISSGPRALGLGGGDNFSKGNVKDANGTISTDRGKFDVMV